MKNTKYTPPAFKRRNRPAQKGHRLMPKAPGFDPQPTTHCFTPAAYQHDFLALCLYPGMGESHTAA